MADPEIIRNTALGHKLLLQFLGPDAYKEYLYHSKEFRDVVRTDGFRTARMHQLIIGAFGWFGNAMKNYPWNQYHTQWEDYLTLEQKELLIHV